MLRVPWFYDGAVVVIDGQTADDTVVGTFLQYYHTVVHGLSMIFLDDAGILRLCQYYTGAVAVLAHQHDVRAIYDDLLLIESFANEYLEWPDGLQWCLLDSILNALAGFHHGVKVVQVLLGLTEHVYEAVLVCALGFQTHSHLVLRIVPVCPFVIGRIQLGRPAAKPSIAIATLMTDVLQPASGKSVAVADIRFTVLQVVISSPDGFSISIFHQLSIAIHTGPRPRALDT